ncbi:MAG: phosphotransferase [Hyphomicrobiales bacterium]
MGVAGARAVPLPPAARGVRRAGRGRAGARWEGPRPLAEALPVRFAELAAPLSGTPETLLHHDLSLRNVLLGDATEAPVTVFIDWELVRRGPAVRDVSYFLGTSTPPGRHDDLLAFYHARLTANGVRDYPLDRLREDYRRSVVCDLARMVMTAGQPSLTPAMAAVVACQLRHREHFDATGLL